MSISQKTFSKFSNEELIQRYIDSWRQQKRYVDAIYASVASFREGNQFHIDVTYIDEKFTRGGKWEARRSRVILDVIMKRIKRGTLERSFFAEMVKNNPETNVLYLKKS